VTVPSQMVLIVIIWPKEERQRCHQERTSSQRIKISKSQRTKTKSLWRRKRKMAQKSFSASLKIANLKRRS
jgi:hypothetical protein